MSFRERFDGLPRQLETEFEVLDATRLFETRGGRAGAPRGCLRSKPCVLTRSCGSPLICPRCSSKIRVLAVITNPAEVKKILHHLIKIGCPPHGLDPAALN